MEVLIEENAWEIIGDSHKLELRIFSHPGHHVKQSYSHEYELEKNGNSVLFQIMLYQIQNNKVLFFIKCSKNEESDDRSYKINFNYWLNKNDDGDDASSVTHKITTDDEGTWRLICQELSIPCVITATLKIVGVLPYQRKKITSLKPNAALHEDTDLIDFQLRGKDGSVHVHKAIAAAASPVLRRMFAGAWRETAEGVVEVPDTTAATLQHFKDYIYLDTIPDSGIEQLLLLASFYMMPHLQQRCVNKLKKFVTPETASDLIFFAANNRVYQLLFAILERVQNGTLDVDKMRSYHST